MVDSRHLVRWGTPRHVIDVSGPLRDFLEREVGAAQPWPTRAVQSLASSRLSADDLSAIADIVGGDYVTTSDAERMRATGGAGYLDWVRHRRGEMDDAPDAVIRPGNAQQVVDVLALAQRRGLVTVPVGGGTSVVGGLRTREPHVALVLDRLGTLLDVDEVSARVTVGPAATGPRLEPLLQARGFTLGHLPQSWARATVGGYVATRSAGQASTGYGRIDDMVEALSVATPRGLLSLGRAPSSAAGPDLRSLFIGSEGALGVITDVTLRVRRLPTERRYEAVMFPSFKAGVAAFRDVAQSRVSADIMRLSDEAETRTSLTLSGPKGMAARALQRYLAVRGIDLRDGALAILGWEGTDRDFVSARRSAAWRVLRANGAVALGKGAGDAWRRGRFDGPHLRDSLMDAGYLVETLETATEWRDYDTLHRGLTAAIKTALPAPPGPYVMSHLSHVYETGASLYTTVVAVADQHDPEGQWTRAKHAAMDYLADHGATVTHHHAIGRDHAPWLVREWGEEGVRLLREVKRAVDPRDVLNPGVLLPRETP